MDCAEARSALWPTEKLRVVDAKSTAARVHVDQCDCCQEYFRQDLALLGLYSRVREIPAPTAVRRRVFDSIASARWSPDRTDGSSEVPSRLTHLRSQGAWPLALLAVIGVAGLSQLRVARTAPEPSAVFVEDYLRRAVGQEHIETDDPTEIRHFLERELGLMLEPMAFEGFDIARAEICLLEGRLGAMIVYKGANGSLSHYLVPRDDVTPRAPVVSTSAASRSMPVVTWATPGLEQALVGEFEAGTLLELTTTGLR